MMLRSANEPLATYKIIEHIPGRSGEHKYKVSGMNKSPFIWKIKSLKRVVPEEQLSKLDDVLNDLLDYANGKRNAKTRNDLLIALRLARNKMTSEQPVRAKDLNSLEKSIEKTSRLLTKLQRDGATIGFQTHADGDGVVEGIHVHDFGTHEGLPCDPSGKLFVNVKIHDLLKAWHNRVKSWPRNKRQRPKKEEKTDIVFYAKEFFCRHAESKPSSDINNPFQAFAQQFYRRVTGTEPGSLEYQIKQVLGEEPAR